MNKKKVTKEKPFVSGYDTMPDIEDLEKTVDRELKKLKDWEEKALQIVNLSPSESWVEKLTEVHPMKQITWAAIIQGVVFGFMLLSFSLISSFIHSEVYDFDFEQMEEDRKRIEASEFKIDFNIKNPKHKYFVAINILDIASTMYALENRSTLYEGNPLLPERPELEELIIQKTLSIYLLKYIGIFSEHPADQWYINSANVLLTGVVLNNLHQINKHD